MHSQGPLSSGNNGQPRLPRIPPDRYTILGELGSGGMGTVLKATHVHLNKPVAIKVLNMELVKDRTSLSRFESEAKAGGQLAHPNLVAVFDFGYTLDGEPYFVMEYVEGFSLAELVKRCGKCPSADFIFVFIQALKALNYIHRKNVIHRDIKSSNIMLQFIEGDRYVKLIDFGIAKVLADTGVTMQQLTSTGEAVGSPLYMSPEQCKGSHVDVRADIYSLGCVMHECFAGYPPFRGGNAMQTIHMHINDPPAPLAGLCKSEQELLIASMIHKCILKRPEDRYQTAAELGMHLEEIANVGSHVQAIQRPTNTVDAANRWKKGNKTTEQGSPMMQGQTGANIPQLARPEIQDATRTSAMQDKFIGGQTQASGLSQTLRRPTSPLNQTGIGPAGLANAAGVPAQEPPQIDERLPERWNLHNVSGQQSMSNGNFYEAERHFLQAVEIAEQFGRSDERLPNSLNRLALCYKSQGRYDDAEKIYVRAVEMREAIVGSRSKDLLPLLEQYAGLLRIVKRDQEAEKIEKRIHFIMKSK
jgi:serine/threonine protein kinase